MSWWLVGSGVDLNVTLTSRGVWSLNGRPSPLESQYEIVHDQAPPVQVARVRNARAIWHLRTSLDGITSEDRYNDLARRRRDASPEMTLGIAVFWPRSHGDDTIEFHLVPPERIFDLVQPMFGQILGRADLSYRIASALIKDREVLPGDWPSTTELLMGRPHFTAGVEFSIFANALLRA